MLTTITARHCELTDALEERTREIMARASGMAPRPLSFAVVFDIDGLDHTVEFRLHISRGDIFVARGEGPDHRTALDRADERLRRQIDSATGRGRRTRHQTEAPAT